MKKKNEIIITEENLQKYIELYNARYYFNDKNYKRVHVAIAGLILLGIPLMVCACNTMSGNVMLFASSGILLLSTSVALLCESVLNNQVKEVKKKYPELDYNIEYSKIKEKVNEYQLSKENTSEDIDDYVFDKIRGAASFQTERFVDEEIKNLNESNENEFNEEEAIIVNKNDTLELLKRKRELLETMIELKEEKNARLTYERSENNEKE